MRVVSQNDPCPCGSGVKFKNCCLQKMMMMGMANHAPEHPGRRKAPEQKKKEEKKDNGFQFNRDEVMKTSPEEQLYTAEKLFSLNREAEGTDLLENILYKRDGEVDYIDIFFKVIDYYKRKENYKRALLFCDELIRYDRDFKSGKYSEESLRIKGELLMYLGNISEGEEILLDLIKKNPDELWNYYGLANAFVYVKNMEKAFKYINEGLNMNVKDPEKVKVLLRRLSASINKNGED